MFYGDGDGDVSDAYIIKIEIHVFSRSAQRWMHDKV